MPSFRRTFFSYLPGCLISLAIVAGCGPEPSLTPSATSLPSTQFPVTGTPTQPATPGTARAPSGSIVVGGVGQATRDVTSLPRFVSDALYDSLLQVDPSDGSLKPGLADSWQVSSDARTFTFHLRSGVVWHDGVPVTARDAAFTIKSLSAPDARLTPLADFGPVANVSVTDSQTVMVRMAEAYCPALTSIATLKILPEHVLSAPHSESQGEQPGFLRVLGNSQFVGTGPLMLKDWNADTVSFIPNANYWDGSAQIANWTYKGYPDVAAAEAALNSGQVDLLALDPGPVRGSLPKNGFSIYSQPANEFYSLAINRERDILADEHTAEALALALNRAELASEAYGADPEPMEMSVLRGFWAAPEDAAQPAYDPGRAKQLLAQSGWTDTDGDGILDKNGKPLTMTLWAIAGDSVDESLAFAIRRMLSDVGVQGILQFDDRAEFLTRLFLHEFDLAIASWNIPLDPDQHWYWESTENKPGEGLNIGSYSNPQVDTLLKRGIDTASCDPAGRRGIYTEAFRTTAVDIAQIFIFAPPAYLAAGTTISGIEPSSFAGDFWNLASWRITP